MDDRGDDGTKMTSIGGVMRGADEKEVGLDHMNGGGKLGSGGSVGDGGDEAMVMEGE